MSSGSTALRYIVPMHLHHTFKGYLSNVGAIYHQDTFLASVLFTVSGSSDIHQRLSKFLKDCKRERRILLILNRRLEAATKEIAVWGLPLVIVKKGAFFTKITVTGETETLDRLERYLKFEALL